MNPAHRFNHGWNGVVTLLQLAGSRTESSEMASTSHGTIALWHAFMLVWFHKV